MRSPVSPEALQLTWNAMRVRPALAHWPMDFDQVMADPVRQRLVQLEASHPSRPPERLVAHTERPEPQKLTPTRAFDHKRAAAGDRDD